MTQLETAPPAGSRKITRWRRRARFEPASHPPDSIIMFGTYAPRRCGIATFTGDLTQALAGTGRNTRVEVGALNDRAGGYDYPPEVVLTIDQDEERDYRLAADWVNSGTADVVCVQHEYGIFGGPDGRFIVEALSRINVPIVTTFHTILKNPSRGQRQVTRDVAQLSERVVVMSTLSRALLQDVYDVEPEKIVAIPHGVPDMPFAARDADKKQLGLSGKRVVLTFGLLSPDKGIENMIRALSPVVADYPDLIYVILGTTHPHIRRASGESYRRSLQQLAVELGIDENVRFHDRYVDLDELCEYLSAADIYATPYLKQEQIVSGTLAYAMGAGKAIVSTPYFYAKEMLADARGRLVPFGDIEALSKTIAVLLDDETKCIEMRQRAYDFMRNSVWSQVARRYNNVFSDVLKPSSPSPLRS